VDALTKKKIQFYEYTNPNILTMENKKDFRKLPTLPLRFNEVKYMCGKYPYLLLTNKTGFTVMMKSKIILNTSVFINTDLTTNWQTIKGISWINYFLIKYHLRHADQL